MKEFLKDSRAPFLTASLIPVILGAALACKQKDLFPIINFVLTMLGMIFAHLGINLANDYFDFKQGADQENKFRNPFSGGSTHLVEGEKSPKQIFLMSAVCLFAALLCGIALIMLVDGGTGPVLWIMIGGFLGGYFYTAPPFKFAYRGWGEFFILVCFGILPTVGTFYVMTKEISMAAVLAGLPIGLLITNVLWINQFPDYKSDKEAGKKTLVVRMGTQKARFVYVIFLAGAAASIIYSMTTEYFSSFYALGFLGLIPAVAASAILIKYHDDPPSLLKGQAMTIVAHLATGILLTIGVLI
jgi:1,4-dihydroxy-2-naphthoate polyprenyltransferase